MTDIVSSYVEEEREKAADEARKEDWKKLNAWAKTVGVTPPPDLFTA